MEHLVTTGMMEAGKNIETRHGGQTVGLVSDVLKQ